jgi:membrane associated rhomboid family serine protease
VTETREPLLNVPPVVATLIGLFVAVHAVTTYGLSFVQYDLFLKMFAFVPARYDQNLILAAWPGGVAADLWTFVSYAFIHADWIHLTVNSVWLLAFGTPLERRFGGIRFAGFFVVTAVAGALAHLVTHPGEMVPMVGASASISGAMAGAIRFAFQRGGPIFVRDEDPQRYRVPALSLAAALREPRVLVFLAVWFGINLVFGLGSSQMLGVEGSIAWQAHVGGFLAGLLFFGWFDPVRRDAASSAWTGT